MRTVLIVVLILLGLQLSWKYWGRYLPSMDDSPVAEIAPLCKGAANSPEDKFIQELVPKFAKTASCEIGDHCISGSDGHYSIAWVKTCQFQKEMDSTSFSCAKNPQTGRVCCSPDGLESVYWGCSGI